MLLDRSFFAPAPATRIDDEAFRPYNVQPDALLVNFRSLRFTFVETMDEVLDAALERAAAERAPSAEETREERARREQHIARA